MPRQLPDGHRWCVVGMHAAPDDAFATSKTDECNACLKADEERVAKLPQPIERYTCARREDGGCGSRLDKNMFDVTDGERDRLCRGCRSLVLDKRHRLDRPEVAEEDRRRAEDEAASRAAWEREGRERSQGAEQAIRAAREQSGGFAVVGGVSMTLEIPDDQARELIEAVDAEALAAEKIAELNQAAKPLESQLRRINKERKTWRERAKILEQTTKRLFRQALGKEERSRQLRLPRV